MPSRDLFFASVTVIILGFLNDAYKIENGDLLERYINELAEGKRQFWRNSIFNPFSNFPEPMHKKSLIPEHFSEKKDDELAIIRCQFNPITCFGK
ncbi:hypothetical protein SprV_0100259500 [Sparganum proliferum]